MIEESTSIINDIAESLPSSPQVAQHLQSTHNIHTATDSTGTCDFTACSDVEIRYDGDDDDDDCGNNATVTTSADIVIGCDCDEYTSVGSGSSGYRIDKKLTSSSLSLNKPNTNQFLKLDDDVFRYILTFIGKHQYRFVGGVNRHFLNSYMSLYPHKTTYLNASTMELTILCLEEIDANWTYDSKKTEEQRLLWQSNVAFGGYWPFDVEKTEQLRLLWYSAAQFGNIVALVFIWNLTKPFQIKFIWRYDLCYKAAEHGQMELLQWALNENFCIDKTDKRVCLYAIGSGNLDAFYWAKDNGFLWHMNNLSQCQEAAHIAAEKGQLEILQWLHELGCDFSSERFCTAAAKSGHLDVVRWLPSVGCDWKDSTFAWAVKGDHVKVVKYMIDNGFKMADWTIDGAAQWGSMDTLQLLHSMNFKFNNNDDVISNAAFGGHLNIIRWALNLGVCLTYRPCYYAAAGGQLDTLKWLRAKGCPWGYLTTTYAKTEEIYSYAVHNGCPVEEGNPRETSYIEYSYNRLLR